MDEESLRSDTRRYWELQRHNDSTDWVLEQYISDKRQKLGGNSLLEAEMEQIRQRSSPEHCETLVLLVGLSLEPLLQSICLYQPARILLVLSDDEYAGEPRHAYVGHVFEAIERLRDEGLIDRVPKYLGKNPAGEGQFVETADDPLAVFRTLVETLRDEPCPVIDITGGKKSMVAGAFLYAAYAGVRISYVDFTEYDPKSRRPYGYLSKIGELPNPYEKFALREWERVRLLYQRYQFREARRLLEDIWKVMSALMADSANALDSLDRYLEYYEKWDQGDYRGAEEIQRDLGNFRQPNAVVELGGRWYRIEGDRFGDRPAHLYGNLQVLQVYVYDELQRIGRLIQYFEEYRSAFLRAGALNEIIMLARLVHLITDENNRSLFLNSLDEETPGAGKVFNVLTDPNREQIDVKKHISIIGFRKNDDPTFFIFRPKPMGSWWEQTTLFKDRKDKKGWQHFLDIRNELAHKYFPVSRQWAEDALRFVEANFEDFLGLRTKDMPLYAEAVPWPELCELCGLQRFLPSSLVRDEAGKGGSE